MLYRGGALTATVVSPLDTVCNAVLGLNWLTETNPKINWATRSIVWTPIPDYKMALLRAILTSNTLDDPLLIPDDEDEMYPDPLKFVPHIFMTLQMFSLRHTHSSYLHPICLTMPLNLKMVLHPVMAQSIPYWSLSVMCWRNSSMIIWPQEPFVLPNPGLGLWSYLWKWKTTHSACHGLPEPELHNMEGPVSAPSHQWSPCMTWQGIHIY